MNTMAAPVAVTLCQNPFCRFVFIVKTYPSAAMPAPAHRRSMSFRISGIRPQKICTAVKTPRRIRTEARTPTPYLPTAVSDSFCFGFGGLGHFCACGGICCQFGGAACGCPCGCGAVCRIPASSASRAAILAS